MSKLLQFYTRSTFYCSTHFYGSTGQAEEEEVAYSGLGIERTADSWTWLTVLEYVVYIEGGEVRGQGPL